MDLRASFTRIIIILSATALLMAACSSSEPALSAPTAYGPLPSPKPAFTGLPLPATLAPPLATPTKSAAQTGNSSTAAVPNRETQAQPITLTILYTNDTRGYVDPCG